MTRFEELTRVRENGTFPVVFHTPECDCGIDCHATAEQWAAGLSVMTSDGCRMTSNGCHRPWRACHVWPEVDQEST